MGGSLHRWSRARIRALVAAWTVVALLPATPASAAEDAGAGSGTEASQSAFAFTRFAGTDRYETAAAIATGRFSDGVSTVVVASGEGFADAMSAAYAAGIAAAPILLTARGALPAATEQAIASLAPDRALIVGGRAAVSTAVEERLRALHLEVRRLSGPDRYGTALAVARSGDDHVGLAEGKRTAIVASGATFADALAIGPISYVVNAPLILASGDALSSGAQQLLGDLAIEQVLVAGGPAAVSPEIERSLVAAGVAVRRLAGPDRTATARAIADYAVAALGFDTSTVSLARGSSFPDALAGISGAGVRRSALLLAATGPGIGAAAKGFLAEHRSTLLSGDLYGGTAAISAAQEADALHAVRAGETGAPNGGTPEPSAPVLVPLTTANSSVQLIDVPAEGGTATLDNGATIEIPAGAFPAGTQLSIGPPGVSTQGGDGSAVATDLGMVSITARDGQPDIPVRVTVPRPATTMSADEQPLLTYFDEHINGWVPIPTTVDPASGAVVGEVAHFSDKGAARLNPQGFLDLFSHRVGRYIGTRAEERSCTSTGPVWFEPESIPSGMHDAVQVCASAEGSDLILSITANRAYSQDVHFGGRGFTVEYVAGADRSGVGLINQLIASRSTSVVTVPSKGTARLRFKHLPSPVAVDIEGTAADSTQSVWLTSLWDLADVLVDIRGMHDRFGSSGRSDQLIELLASTKKVYDVGNDCVLRTIEAAEKRDGSDAVATLQACVTPQVNDTYGVVTRVERRNQEALRQMADGATIEQLEDQSALVKELGRLKSLAASLRSITAAFDVVKVYGRLIDQVGDMVSPTRIAFQAVPRTGYAVDPAAPPKEKILRSPDTAADYVDRTGYRHPIPDGGTYECLARTYEVIDQVARSQIDQLPLGEPARCVDIRVGDIIRARDDDAYVLEAAPFARYVRRWIPDGGTFQCLQAQGRRVVDVERYHVEEIAPGAQAQATCFDPAGARGKVIVTPDDYSYYVDKTGYRHWIPDTATFGCITRTAAVIRDVAWSHVVKIPETERAACLDAAPGDIIRTGDGDAYLLEAAPAVPYVRRWIPDGGTYLCLTSRGARVVAATRYHVEETPPGPNASARCVHPDVTRNAVVEVTSTKASYFIDGEGGRHWIPDGETYYCMTARGYPVHAVQDESSVEGFPDRGTQPRCLDPDRVKNKIVRQPDSGTAHMVDGSGVARHIPTGGVYLCLKAWRSVPVVDNLTAEHVGSLTHASDKAACRVDEAAGKIIRHADSTSYYVDGNLVRHWIPDGETYYCVAGRGAGLIDNLTTDHIEAIAKGDPHARCLDPERVKNKIVREGGGGTSYLVDSSGLWHWIPDGGTYECLRSRHALIDNVTWEHINSLRREGDHARC